MPYLWAAYRRDVFKEMFKDGLSPTEFTALVHERTAALMAIGGDAYILLARTFKGTIPVGLVAMTVHQGQAWPHVAWFPEAKSRNKVECALKFLLLLKEKINAVIPSKQGDVAFFDHLCKYGVLRRIGTGRGWFGPEDAILFETVRR